MGSVDLEHPEASPQGAPGGGLEGRDHLLDAGLVQRHRDRAALAERERAGADDGPASLPGRHQRASTFPGRLRAGLAPGVAQLDAGDRPLSVDEPRDTGQGLDVLVAPDSQVSRGDPAVAGDGRGLGHDQRRPAHRPAAEMDQVPVVAQALLGTVLAHRGHDDPVAEGHAADREGAEQSGEAGGAVLGLAGHPVHGSSR